MGLAVSDYSLEVDASEYVNSIHIDGDDPVDEYSLEERQQQQQQQQQGPETDTELEETPVEESSDLLQNVVEAVPDPLYSVEEPLAEPLKLTYASIVCNFSISHISFLHHSYLPTFRI